MFCRSTLLLSFCENRFCLSQLLKKLNSTERGALFRHFCVSKVFTTAHAHKSGVIFHFFPRAFKQKKIKALRPKMTKIASRGGGGPALIFVRKLHTKYTNMKCMQNSLHLQYLKNASALIGNCVHKPRPSEPRRSTPANSEATKKAAVARRRIVVDLDWSSLRLQLSDLRSSRPCVWRFNELLLPRVRTLLRRTWRFDPLAWTRFFFFLQLGATLASISRRN